MKDIIKYIFCIVYFILFVNIVSAGDLIPQGNISLKGIYGIKNATLITFLDGSQMTSAISITDNSSWNQSFADSRYLLQSNEGNLNVNKSNYWDNFNITNSTQINNSGGVLNIMESWLTTFFNTLFSSKTTDNLTQGTISLYDNRSWNETRATSLYAPISVIGDNSSWNQSLANTLYLSLTDQRYNETTYINTQISNNNASWTSTYNSTYDSKVSYNSTFNQSLTDTLYSSIIWNHNQSPLAGNNITVSGRTVGLNGTSLKNWLDTLYQTIGSYLLVSDLPLTNRTISSWDNVTNKPANLDTDSTNDLLITDLPLHNRTLVNCLNITGADADFCNDATGGSSFKGDGIYLYNDSTTMYFNQTKENITINSLIDLDELHYNSSIPDQSYTDTKVSTNNLHKHDLLNLTGIDDNACSGTDKVSNVTINNGVLSITCTSDVSGGSGLLDSEGFYLYDNTTRIFFNETRLNNTIDNRDSDTTYTNGSGLSLVGTQFNHSDTSSQANSDNSARTYIQDILLDTFGHITSISTATETVVDTDTQKKADGSYLYNDSTTIYYNETKGNNTISNLGVSIGFNSTFNSTYANFAYNQTPIAGSNISVSGTTVSINTTSLKNWLDTIYQAIGNYLTQAVADTLYAGIEWDYNQTTSAITDINNRFWNKTDSYNKTQIDTQIITNGSYFSTYNVTYHGLINNASYLSTYNSTYDAKVSFPGYTNIVLSNQTNPNTIFQGMNITLQNNLSQGQFRTFDNGTCLNTYKGTTLIQSIGCG